ncbi:hypothetical protein COS81_04665 [candidate division WWE3 bacterium CG06_land_8_20_14_3_00_42_16]|uniref:Uncharacterized protein n=3 Tax=Katanobacteria TaxID=422282 RepID=A0A2M7ALM8_UNCKA|nr:MAG: hypothetical protein COS81_04665 [candidate division WWE3 bacterium CG06_land_8_20_14_3_00_42_16]PJA38444.1 MAG: hypothetical protein CO181_00420 [candidate division WWE3 bacterium CG_4_9_14_3_um_filter_43_9]PJC68948.1 MAG: hypothetical protein CO015_02155 [candidate division WWE3 bacterium CG_4_8_14_3_um_filter_42_11]
MSNIQSVVCKIFDRFSPAFTFLSRGAFAELKKRAPVETTPPSSPTESHPVITPPQWPLQPPISK